MTETQNLITKDESEKILKRAKINRALRDKDIPAYEKISLEWYKDVSAASFKELNSPVWNAFDNEIIKHFRKKQLPWRRSF